MPTTSDSQPVNGSPYRIRDPHASALSEIWLVAAVAAILIIRAYLHLTGFPQVGGDDLHIAHMLWGGLGMVVAFGMLVLFASDAWKPIAALVGGFSFGVFIDELGKFITQDNDYLFEPAIAIIYGVLVAVLVISRTIKRSREPTAADHLYYAVQGVQWQAIGKLDRDRQRAALHHLDASGVTTPFTESIRQVLTSAQLIEDERAQGSHLLDWRLSLTDRYWRLIQSRWLARLLIGIFVLKAIQIALTLLLGFTTGSLEVGSGITFAEWGTYLSAAASGGLAVFGLVQLFHRARRAALQAFANAALVSILFGQFFAFASSEFAALASLLIELVILSALRFVLFLEEENAADECTSAEHRDVSRTPRASSRTGAEVRSRG